MRVATLNTAQTAFDGIAARQAEQARLQTQLTTGLRVNSPGDDPVAAAQAELARSRLSRVAQDQRATQLASGLMQAAEGALGQGVDLLQSVREVLVAAGNGSYSASERQALVVQLQSARDSLLAVANTRDGAGSFVFGGQGSQTAPVSGVASPAYGAVAGTQQVGAGGAFAASVDGRASFMALPQGNGVFVTASAPGNTGSAWVDPGSVTNPALLTGHDYRVTVTGAPGAQVYAVADLTAGTTLVAGVPFVAGNAIDVDGQRIKVSGAPASGDSFEIGAAGQQSIFQTLDEAIATLSLPVAGAGYTERLQRVQANLDRGLDSLILMRSRVGSELNRLDTAGAANQEQELVVTQRLSALQDLDFTQGISALQNNQTALEAGLKSYASIARTSLFQLLG